MSDGERLLSECRQQNIVLEGQLEQSQDDLARIRTSLDNYKQKYQECTEQLAATEDTVRTVQEQLATSRNKVSKQSHFITFDMRE